MSRFKEPLLTAQRHISNASPPRKSIMTTVTTSTRTVNPILAALDAELERLNSEDASAHATVPQTSNTMEMALSSAGAGGMVGSHQGTAHVMQKPVYPFFIKPSIAAGGRPASSKPMPDPAGPNVLTATDNATSARNAVPSKKPSTPFPLYSYKHSTPRPTMLYVRDESQANELVSELEGPLGFDLEWRVFVGRRKMERKTAVLQICDDKIILIIQLSEMKCFPEKLKAIVESPDIIKMGINIIGDGHKLHRDYGLNPAGLLELTHLAHLADPTRVTSKRMISLQRIVEMYTGCTLCKGPVRCSNWEAKLSEEQLEYAANDAHSALGVYTELMRIAADARMVLCPIAIPSSSSTTPMGITFLVDPSTGHEGGPQATTAAKDERNYATFAESQAQPKPKPPSTRILSSLSSRPAFRAVHITSPEELHSRPDPTKAGRPIGRQPLRAYKLWHQDHLSLPDMCGELRSPENPLAKGTVITYVVQALKEDTALPFSRVRLRELVKLDSWSWERHGWWVDGLEKTGRGWAT